MGDVVNPLDSVFLMRHHSIMEDLYKQFAAWGSVGGRTRARRLLKSKRRRSANKSLQTTEAKLERGNKPGMFAERDREIASLYKSGSYTLESIGAKYSLTRERVRQLLVRQGVALRDGGRYKTITGRKISETAKKEKNRQARIESVCRNRLDCSVEEYSSITGMAYIDWRMAHRLAKAYFCQKQTALYRRNIGWEITFPEWYEVWRKSGKVDERGRGQGKWVMSRIADIGPYRVDNVNIVPAIENNSDRNDKKSILPMGVKREGKKFVAVKMIRGKSYRVGGFLTPEDAHEAYLNFKAPK